MFPPPPRVKRDNASDGKFSALPEATDEVCAHVFRFVDIVCCFCWGGKSPPTSLFALRANTRRPPLPIPISPSSSQRIASPSPLTSRPPAAAQTSKNSPHHGNHDSHTTRLVAPHHIRKPGFHPTDARHFHLPARLAPVHPAPHRPRNRNILSIPSHLYDRRQNDLRTLGHLRRNHLCLIGL